MERGVGGVERGERNVSLVNIWKIADALEINPSSLFAGPCEASTSDTVRGRGAASAEKKAPKEERTWTRRRKRER